MAEKYIINKSTVANGKLVCLNLQKLAIMINKLSLNYIMARIKRKTNRTHKRENRCVKICKLKPFKDIVRKTSISLCNERFSEVNITFSVTES